MLTNTVAPRHIEAVGVGLDIAAEMLVTAGDNTAGFRPRRPSPRGATPAPSQAGSAKTNGRHRLNRGRNRQATAALYRAAVRRGHGQITHRSRRSWVDGADTGRGEEPT